MHSRALGSGAEPRSLGRRPAAPQPRSPAAPQPRSPAALQPCSLSVAPLPLTYGCSLRHLWLQACRRSSRPTSRGLPRRARGPTTGAAAAAGAAATAGAGAAAAAAVTAAVAVVSRCLRRLEQQRKYNSSGYNRCAIRTAPRSKGAVLAAPHRPPSHAVLRRAANTALVASREAVSPKPKAQSLKPKACLAAAFKPGLAYIQLY